MKESVDTAAPALQPKSLVGKKNRRGAEAELRLSAVLDVAQKLFLKRGYSHTSLNDVIARSKGSKATLLKYFGSKAGLFSAVIASVSERFVAAKHLGELRGAPTHVLQKFGETVLRFYLDHASLVTYRGVVAEGYRYVPMASAFYKQGHALVVTALAERLTEWNQEGLVHSIQCAEDADAFLHLLRHGIYEQTLLGLRKTSTPAEITTTVEHAVRIFLGGIR